MNQYIRINIRFEALVVSYMTDISLELLKKDWDSTVDSITRIRFPFSQNFDEMMTGGFDFVRSIVAAELATRLMHKDPVFRSKLISSIDFPAGAEMKAVAESYESVFPIWSLTDI